MPKKPAGTARTIWMRFTVNAAEKLLIEAALAAAQMGDRRIKMMNYLRAVVLERAERDAAEAHDVLRQYSAATGTNVSALLVRAMQDPKHQRELAEALAKIVAPQGLAEKG